MTERLNETPQARSFSKREIQEAQDFATDILTKVIKGELTGLEGITLEEKSFLEKARTGYAEAQPEKGSQLVTIQPSSEDQPIYEALHNKLTQSKLYQTVAMAEKASIEPEISLETEYSRFFDSAYIQQMLDVIIANPEIGQKVGTGYGLLMESPWFRKQNSWGMSRKGGSGMVPTKEEYVAEALRIEDILKEAGKI